MIYTNVYSFNLIPSGTVPYHTYEHENWENLDALLNVEHTNEGRHTGVIVLNEVDIPAEIARIVDVNAKVDKAGDTLGGTYEYEDGSILRPQNDEGMAIGDVTHRASEIHVVDLFADNIHGVDFDVHDSGLITTRVWAEEDPLVVPFLGAVVAMPGTPFSSSIVLAKADDANRMPARGVIVQINDLNDIWIRVFGKIVVFPYDIHPANTLYVSTTAGYLQDTPPTSAYQQIMGFMYSEVIYWLMPSYQMTEVV